MMRRFYHRINRDFFVKRNRRRNKRIKLLSKCHELYPEALVSNKFKIKIIKSEWKKKSQDTITFTLIHSD